MLLELIEEKDERSFMKKKVLSVNDLTEEDFHEITKLAKRKKNAPLIKSQQIIMRLTEDLVKMAKVLAKRAGKPTTTFLSDLLREDLIRIWKLVG